MITRLRKIGPARLVLIVVGLLALIIAIWPGLFTSNDPHAIDSNAILQLPSFAHPFGTDEAGADVLSRILYATRLELSIAVGSMLIGLLIGLPTGLIAGYSNKFVDAAFSGMAAATLAFPLILFAILMVASLGTTTISLVGIIGFLFFPRVFLLIRAQTKSLKEREFIEATKVIGVSSTRILFRHILPNATGPLLNLVPQMMAEALLVEAGLSYLGLGVQLPDATWGTILQNSKRFYVTSPAYAVIAGLTITAAAALLLWAGELLSESTNPLKRGRRA